MSSKTIVIIGGGPAGYSAAIEAAKRNTKVILIEREKIGGLCVHNGCIPTKSYLHTVSLIQEIKENKTIIVDKAKIDVNKCNTYTKEIINELEAKMNYMIKKSKILYYKGNGKIITKNKVIVEFNSRDNIEIECDYIIIATGSKLKKIQLEREYRDYSINELLSSQSVINKICILGGSSVGIEYAVILNALGIEVTVVEKEKQILPTMDSELVSRLQYLLENQGITFKLNSTIPTGKDIIICCGREANIGKEIIENKLVDLDRGLIKVNGNMQTSCQNIYAIGDCASERMEANIAIKQGENAIQHIFDGKSIEIENIEIPKCVYTPVEIASVGFTQEEAIESGFDTGVCEYSFSNNAASRIFNDELGMIKIVYNNTTNIIIGVHILSKMASELIGIGTLAVAQKMTVETLKRIVFPHPTISESFSFLI